MTGGPQVPEPEPGPGSKIDHELMLRVGRAELLLRKRYELASIVNDILIALWFLIGSIMFFSARWETAGTWCFVFGSVELLVRPVIRLTRHVHLHRIHRVVDDVDESSQDF